MALRERRSPQPLRRSFFALDFILSSGILIAYEVGHHKACYLGLERNHHR